MCLQANDKLCIVDSADLRLDDAEAAELIRLRAEVTVNQSAVRKLIERSQGWAAGLSLLIDHHRSDLKVSKWADGAELQSVFDYFAGEIFRHMDPDVQAFALKSAFLPQMGRETVERLTGNPKGARILSDFTRRNFFTTRHAGQQTVYQYHHLFRQFLFDWAQERFGSVAVKELKTRAAHILAEAEFFEASAEYFLEIEDWESLVTVIGKVGPMLLNQGRNKTLLVWIERIPEEILGRYPWFRFWQGASLQMIDFAGARAALGSRLSRVQERG